MEDCEHESKQTPQEETLLTLFNNALRVRNTLGHPQILNLFLSTFTPASKEASKYRNLVQTYPSCLPLSILYNKKAEQLTLFYLDGRPLTIERNTKGKIRAEQKVLPNHDPYPTQILHIINANLEKLADMLVNTNTQPSNLHLYWQAEKNSQQEEESDFDLYEWGSDIIKKWEEIKNTADQHKDSLPFLDIQANARIIHAYSDEGGILFSLEAGKDGDEIYPVILSIKKETFGDRLSIHIRGPFIPIDIFTRVQNALSNIHADIMANTRRKDKQDDT